MIDKLLGVTATVGGVFIAYILVLAVALMIAGTKCAELGYSDTIVGYDLRAYCTRTVDATDQVVPLADLETK